MGLFDLLKKGSKKRVLPVQEIVKMAQIHEPQSIYYPDGQHCSMVDIKAEELEDFVTKRLAYEIYKHPDLVEVYNSVNPSDEIRKLGYHLRGIKTAINNTTKAIGKGTPPELEERLSTHTSDRDIFEARINDLRAQQKTMTESDRKAVCRELEKFLKDAKNCESKQYIRTTVGEIRVSNESIQLTINAA